MRHELHSVRTVSRERGFEPIPKVRLKEEVFAQALERFINVCADVLIVCEDTFYLVQRKSKPMSGVWWFIGGSMNPGELEDEAAARIFFRETKLDIPSG